MKTIKITELKKETEPQKIEAFRAQVKKVYEGKSGEGAKGAWSLQNIIVTDGSNDFKVVFSGRSHFTPADIEGTEIFVKSHVSKTGNMSGIMLKFSEYQEKVRQELWIYESAKLSFGDDNTGSAIIDYPTETKSTESKDEFEEFNKSEDSVDAVKQLVLPAANMMLLCLDAAMYVKEQFESKHDTGMSREHFQAITSSLFINADKRGLITKVPNTIQ
jgi:CRISPR/Cas system CMR-associated protein Cmr3 (group 5 of RAMP superfamily)